MFEQNESGFYSSGMGWNSGSFQSLVGIARDWEDELAKAYTTGQGIVTEGVGAAGDFSKTRLQFIRDGLESATFSQDDAKLMKLIKKETVYSTTVEWSALMQYGQQGDGFISESGNDGAFNGSSADDIVNRLLRNVKYLYAQREIGLVAQQTKGVVDPVKQAQKSATNEIVMRCNNALYWGDSKTSQSQFDGVARQLMDWITPTTGSGNTQDYGILFDAGNAPIDQNMLNEIAMGNKLRFGNAKLLVMSTTAYADVQKLLFPYQRTDLGSGSGSFGVVRNEFNGQYGTIKFEIDNMLRINQPLVLEGTGFDGKPRAASDTGGAACAAGTLAASSTAAGSAGTGSEWLNKCISGSSPASSPRAGGGSGTDGNNKNRLDAGTYYYAISTVYNGKESAAIYAGTSANGTATITSAVAITVTAGQIVTITLTHTGVTIPSGATYKDIKFRIYRAPGTISAGSLVLSSFDLLMETGMSSTTTTVCYDNGFYIPGCDNAFLFTQEKDGMSGLFLAQLLPLMRRHGLPEKLLSSPLALLLFATPVVPMPRHHVWIRNIGRASL